MCAKCFEEKEPTPVATSVKNNASVRPLPDWFSDRTLKSGNHQIMVKYTI